MPEIARWLDWEDLGTDQEAVGKELEPEFSEAYGKRAAGVLRIYLLDQLRPYLGDDGRVGVRDLDKTHPYDMSDYAAMDIVTFEVVRMEYTDRVRDVARRLARERDVEGLAEAPPDG